jgi:hypothetical protein
MTLNDAQRHAQRHAQQADFEREKGLHDARDAHDADLQSFSKDVFAPPAAAGDPAAQAPRSHNGGHGPVVEGLEQQRLPLHGPTALPVTAGDFAVAQSTTQQAPSEDDDVEVF